MFFCQIDQRAETTLRFIQNFDISLTMDDGNSSPGHKFATINIDITPLMLRVSYKDMVLILDIFKQFTTLSSLSAEFAQKVDDVAAYSPTSVAYDAFIMSRERVCVYINFVYLVASFYSRTAFDFDRRFK
jgi:vacuolar protein sorting-associated protein 13A/C